MIQESFFDSPKDKKNKSKHKILHGDCLEQMKTLPDNSVDAIVTDPPYGIRFMGKAWDGADIARDFEWGGKKNGIASAAGKYSRDYSDMLAFQTFSQEWATQAFRVLKPGGHLLSFASTRTYHRMASGIEDAGFEIRDQIMWIFGSGFPKSTDVSKRIDKEAGVERKILGIKKDADGRSRSSEDWAEGNVDTTFRASKLSNNFETTPATNQAKQWQGWGTALKPANEPIVVARKPLEKGLTVAENVLKYGTGALNIDVSRIGPAVDSRRPQKSFCHSGEITGQITGQITGRWPANILFDEEAAEMLDAQTGKLAPQGGPKKKDSAGKFYGGGTKDSSFFGDSGGASRFFYVAKASKRERNAGLEGMPEKDRPLAISQWKNQTNGSGEVMGPSKPQTNHHPTVKPIKLMEYLIKLVTPPKGTVLDPFMGSGSTGVACKNLGFNFIGCEMNDEYIEIAKRRIGA